MFSNFFDSKPFFKRLNKSQLDLFIAFSSGAFSGLIADVITYPIDTIRARKQVLSQSKGINLSLFRGLGIVSLVTVPEHALYFFVYEMCVSKLQPHIDRDSKSSAVYFASGVLAEMIDVIIFNPIDVIKQKLQISGQETKLKWSDTFSKPSDLYRGVIPSVLCHGPYLGIYWSLYEPLKKYIFSVSGDNESLMSVIVSSIISSSFAAAITNPLDVVRTRVQTSSSNIGAISVIKQMMQHEGIQSFSLGLGSRVLYLSPSTALLICIFEFSKKRIYEYIENRKLI